MVFLAQMHVDSTNATVLSLLHTGCWSALPPAPVAATWPATCLGMQHGGICSATCSVGLTGTPFTTCLESGAWSPVTGACQQAGSQVFSCFRILQLFDLPLTDITAVTVSGSMLGLPLRATVQVNAGQLVCNPSAIQINMPNVRLREAVAAAWPSVPTAVTDALNSVTFAELASRAHSSAMILAGQQTVTSGSVSVKFALDTDGLAMLAVGITDGMNLGDLLASAGVSGLPSDLPNMLGVSQPMLWYNPRSVSFADDSGFTVPPGATLTATLSAPALNIPATTVAAPLRLPDGRLPTSFTLRWTTAFTVVPGLSITNMQMTLAPGRPTVSAEQLQTQSLVRGSS